MHRYWLDDERCSKGQSRSMNSSKQSYEIWTSTAWFVSLWNPAGVTLLKSNHVWVWAYAAELRFDCRDPHVKSEDMQLFTDMHCSHLKVSSRGRLWCILSTEFSFGVVTVGLKECQTGGRESKWRSTTLIVEKNEECLSYTLAVKMVSKVKWGNCESRSTGKRL